MQRFSQFSCTLYRRTVRCFLALVSAWLFVSCLVTTNFIPFDAVSKSYLCTDSTWLQCLAFSLLCVLPVLLSKKQPVLSASDFSRLEKKAILLGGFLAALWIICIQPIPHMDPGSVQRAAFEFSQGCTDSFQPGGYMYVYPHQSGLFLVHLLLQYINPNTTLPFQFLNVLCYMAILFSLGALARELGFSAVGCLAAECMGILFLPLPLMVCFVYGTVPGLCFAMLSLVFSVRFSRSPKGYHWLIIPLCVFLAVLFKSNYQIFAIGLMLYLLYQGLRGKTHCFRLMIPVAFCCLFSTKLAIGFTEMLTGCQLRSGFASVSWAAMGLRDVSPRGPGWYDQFTDTSYEAAMGDPAIQSTLCLAEIRRIFGTFLRDPGSMVSFFVRKNATQWSDPLFESVWLNISSREVVPKWTEFLLVSQRPNAIGWLMNLLQTLIYGGLVLWAWVPAKEKRTPAEDLLAVIVLGGFVFHTFWEAKSQYTLPYVVLILPLALLGYRRLSVLRDSPSAKARLMPISEKIRFLMPVLLMLLALVLSALLKAPLAANLTEFLQTVS